MEMALGALPHPGRVLEQRLLSPKICRWWRRSCRTLSRKSPIVLGLSFEGLFIGRGVAPGATRATSPLGGAARGWPAPPYGVATLWPPSGSRSVFVLRPGKIGVSAFVSSDSENISCVDFLKHKNSSKQGTDTVASCQ
jgi:hypothetical protein